MKRNKENYVIFIIFFTIYLFSFDKNLLTSFLLFDCKIVKLFTHQNKISFNNSSSIHKNYHILVTKYIQNQKNIFYNKTLTILPCYIKAGNKQIICFYFLQKKSTNL